MARHTGKEHELLRLRDPNHMVTTGSEGSFAADFLAAHGSDRIDYATCHICLPGRRSGASNLSAPRTGTRAPHYSGQRLQAGRFVPAWAAGDRCRS